MAQIYKKNKKYKYLSLAFFILFLISAVIFVYSLRSNYSHMTTLRNQVYSADENNGDIKTALNNLRDYVTTHMNTSLTSNNSVYPPIQLEYTYQRLLETQIGTGSNNSKIYSDAEYYCQKTVPNGFYGAYRIPCVENYINTHGLSKISVDPSLYQFDFASPTWSSDLAGFMMLITIFMALMCLIFIALLSFS